MTARRQMSDLTATQPNFSMAGKVCWQYSCAGLSSRTVVCRLVSLLELPVVSERSSAEHSCTGTLSFALISRTMLIVCRKWLH
jgi:hypothetical protein